jgi:hypothetical protein
MEKHLTYSGVRTTLRTKAPPINWHLQLSHPKRVHALRAVSGKGHSAYTDIDSFKTICQIHDDELDVAMTQVLVHHIRGEVTPDEQAFGTFTRRKIKQLLIWDLQLASRWK